MVDVAAIAAECGGALLLSIRGAPWKNVDVLSTSYGLQREMPSGGRIPAHLSLAKQIQSGVTGSLLPRWCLSFSRWCEPEGPSTLSFRLLAPKAMPAIVSGTRDPIRDPNIDPKW